MKRYKSTTTLAKDILREIKRADRSAKQNRLIWFTVYAQKQGDGNIDIGTHESHSEFELLSGRGIIVIYMTGKFFSHALHSDGTFIDREKVSKLTAEELFGKTETQWAKKRPKRRGSGLCSHSPKKWA